MKKKIIKNILLVFLWLTVCFILNLGIEAIARNGFTSAFMYLKFGSLRFMYNYAIILLITTPIFLFKRRGFLFLIISIILTTLSVVSRMLVKFRGSPLTGTDFLMIKEGLEVSNQYLNFKIIIPILSTTIICGIILVCVWRVESNNRLINKKNLIIPFILVITTFYGFKTYIFNNSIIESNFADLYYAYEHNGFIYSLINTTFNNKPKKPEEYSIETINDIKSKINKSQSLSEINNVEIGEANIVIVQLESFFDPMTIKDTEYSSDPIPNFRKLMDKYSSGNLKVSTIGGGTIRTEFEVLTGLSMDNLPAGEMPYNTILKKKPIDSTGYLMKSKGYKTHAIHNHEGTFYDRYDRYKNLGFDTFTPIEYMSNYDRNITGWAKDKILTQEIDKAIKSTREKDFVFAVSVQGHGGYPSEYNVEDNKIKVKSNISKIDTNSLEYYVNQVNEMDEFIGELINTINENNEPTILVLYGDHLPGLQLDNSDLSNNDKYMVPYVIWDNIDLNNVKENIHSWQLSTKITELLSIDGNNINEFHRLYSNSNNYYSKFELIQYDLIYGKQYLYNNNYPVSTNIKLGINEVNIKKVYKKGKDIIIKGNGFTPHSKVYINNNEVASEFINSSNIDIKNQDININDNIIVKQVGRNNIILGETKAYKFK